MQFTKSFSLSGPNRRSFFRAAAASSLVSAPVARPAEADKNVLGPRPGYSPQIGTLVSEMTWMRGAVLRSAQGLTQDQLDFLLDNKANRIGALLLHLAATERLYQLNTFDRIRMQDLQKTGKFQEWDVAMELGKPARKAIKGHNLNYYLDRLHEVRERTLAEFRKRDDAWFMTIDKSWGWGPTNNLCKWFHVCEHESHRNGAV